MKPVSDWRQSWRWLSMHAMTLALAVSAAWLAIPEDLRAMVPGWSAAGLTAALMVLGVAGRLVDQSPKPDADDEAGA